MGKKVRKFAPRKTYRFLPGMERESRCIADLREYNRHRYNVFAATAKIDHHPLKMNPAAYLRKGKIVDDIFRVKAIDRENKELVKRINLINRRGGTIDSFNPAAYIRMDNWSTHLQRLKAIDRENKVIYAHIVSAQSRYKYQELWAKMVEEIKHSCKMPYNILDKKGLDEELTECPSISEGLEQGNVDRPLCFLEFQETSGRYVGRILIELYYDHVPVTVQNFLEICSGDDLTYQNCLVHRIVKGQFLETGDITKGNGRGGFSIYGKTFHEENHMLKHTRAGIISMKRIGMSENNSQFCITFKKMEQLDHKNVVFGKVIKGNDTLFKIEAYGRKVGKPYADIIISKCGQVFLPHD